MIYQYDTKMPKEIKNNFKFYGKAKDKCGTFCFWTNSKTHLYKIINNKECTILKLNLLEIKK